MDLWLYVVTLGANEHCGTMQSCGDRILTAYTIADDAWSTKADLQPAFVLVFGGVVYFCCYCYWY